jgi:hypothetical protein
MPRAEISTLILKQLQDHKAHSINEVVERTMSSATGIYESDVKSTVLGLVRRNRLQVTDDSKVLLPEEELALVG